MPSQRTRRLIRRGALAAALAGSMFVLGTQIKRINAKPVKGKTEIERVEKKTPTVREAEPIRRAEPPVYVAEILHQNMNAGSIEQVETRWTRMAERARGVYRARPGPRYVPAPDSDVNAACAAGAHATRIPEAMLKAVMRKESQYDPYVVSNLLAMGPMQLKPDAMAQLVKIGRPVQNPFDLTQSTTGGGFLLQHYFDRCRTITNKVGKKFVTRNRTYAYGSQQVGFNQLPVDVQYRIVLRTYNAGPGILGEYKNRDGSYNVNGIIDHHYPIDVMNFYYQNVGR